MEFSVIDPVAAARLILVILLHFVWQATFICLAVMLIRALIQPRHVQARYATAVFGLLMLVVVTIATTGYYVFFDTSMASLHSVDESLLAMANVNTEPGTVFESFESQFMVVFSWFDANRSWWLGFWTIGVLLLIGRLIGSLIYCFQLRRSRIALPPHLERLALDIKSRLNLTRNVVVASSRQVSQAVATGIIKPVVLIPVSWVSELPLSAIEAVLAHELAHVKRWDLWVNLLQRLTETVFFFHPLVWWLSKAISSEREICCDQLAIRATGKPLKYVETLAQIASAAKADNLEIQLGTAFKGGKNMKLLRRARMILEPSSVDSGSPFRALTLVVCVAMLVSLGSYAYCSYPAAVQEDDDEIIQRIELLVDDIENRHELDELHEAHGIHVELKHEGHVDRREIARKLRALADQLESGNAPKLHARLHREESKPHEHRYRLRAQLHDHDDKKEHEEHELRIHLQEQDGDGKEIQRYLLRGRLHEHDGDHEKQYEYRIRAREKDGNIELDVHPEHETHDLIVGEVRDAKGGRVVDRVIRLREAEANERFGKAEVEYLHAGNLLLRDAKVDRDVEKPMSGRIVVDGDRIVRRGTVIDGDRKILRGTVIDGDRPIRGRIVVDGEPHSHGDGIVVDRVKVRRGGGVIQEDDRRVRAGATSEDGMKEALQELRNQVEHLRHEIHELKSKRKDRVRESGRILRERIVDPQLEPLKLEYRFSEHPKVEARMIELELDTPKNLSIKKVPELSEVPRLQSFLKQRVGNVVEEVEDGLHRKGTVLRVLERIADPESDESNGGEWMLNEKKQNLIELKFDDSKIDKSKKEPKEINVELIKNEESNN